MKASPWRRRVATIGIAVLLGGAPGPARAAAPPPAPLPLGNNTYRLTCTARWTFSYNTEKLERQARDDAEKFCAGLGRRMKEVSISSEKASVLFGGLSQATLIFKALEPSDPALGSPPATAAATSDLQVLVDLHDQKVLSDAEFAAAKQRLEDESGKLAQLVELRNKGILSQPEFEAAKARLAARNK